MNEVVPEAGCPGGPPGTTPFAHAHAGLRVLTALVDERPSSVHELYDIVITACAPSLTAVGVATDVRDLSAAGGAPLRAVEAWLPSGQRTNASLQGGHNRVRAVFHTAEWNWTYTEVGVSPSGSCRQMNAVLAARMDALCVRDGLRYGEGDVKGHLTEVWPRCLTGTDGEPLGHTVQLNEPGHTVKPSTFDMQCKARRQRAIYGTQLDPVPEPGAHPPTTLHGHSRPWGEQGQPTLPLPEVQGCLSPHEFLTRFAYAHRPVVMRGCALGTAAVERWTDEYIVEVAADWHGNPHLKDFDMTARRFVEANLTPPGITYVTRHSVPRALRRDVSLPRMLRCEEMMPTLENLVVWWNAGGERSGLHFDGGDFFLTQVDGSKNAALVDPVESHLLYADHDDENYGHSPVDSKRVDLLRFPLAAHATIHNATLAKGDMLYIPQTWWHVIHSLPDSRNLAYTIQLHFPPPDASAHLSDSRFSYYLIQKALRWRDGATGPEWRVPVPSLPARLRRCAQRDGNDDDERFSLETHPALVGERSSGWSESAYNPGSS